MEAAQDSNRIALYALGDVANYFGFKDTGEYLCVLGRHALRGIKKLLAL